MLGPYPIFRLLFCAVAGATLCTKAAADVFPRYRVTRNYEGPTYFDERIHKLASFPVESIDDPKPSDDWTFGLTPRELLARIAPELDLESYARLSTPTTHAGDYSIGKFVLQHAKDYDENGIRWPLEVVFMTDGKQYRSNALSPALAEATYRSDIMSFYGNEKGQFLLSHYGKTWYYDFGSDTVSPIMSLFAGSSNVNARSINSQGAFVGDTYGTAADGVSRSIPFIYENGVMRDLNDLVNLSDGVLINYVSDLSETGEIIAIRIRTEPADSPQSVFEYVLLTPIVPEPSSWMILASVFGFAWIARRRLSGAGSIGLDRA